VTDDKPFDQRHGGSRWRFVVSGLMAAPKRERYETEDKGSHTVDSLANVVALTCEPKA